MIDIRINPFTFEYRPTNKTGEVKTVQYFDAFKKVGYFLSEMPIRLNTQPVSIVCGGDTLAEVGRTVTPGENNFRVDYGNVNNAASTGFVEIHASRIGQVAVNSYRAIGGNLNSSHRSDAVKNIQRSVSVAGGLTSEGLSISGGMLARGNVALATGGGSTISAGGKRILAVASAVADTDAMTFGDVVGLRAGRWYALQQDSTTFEFSTARWVKIIIITHGMNGGGAGPGAGGRSVVAYARFNPGDVLSFWYDRPTTHIYGAMRNGDWITHRISSFDVGFIAPSTRFYTDGTTFFSSFSLPSTGAAANPFEPLENGNPSEDGGGFGWGVVGRTTNVDDIPAGINGELYGGGGGRGSVTPGVGALGVILIRG